jgi:hypothetical protein
MTGSSVKLQQANGSMDGGDVFAGADDGTRTVAGRRQEQEQQPRAWAAWEASACREPGGV